MPYGMHWRSWDCKSPEYMQHYCWIWKLIERSHKPRSGCDMYNYGIVSLSHVDAVYNFGLYINSLIDCISSSSSIRTVGDLHPFLKTLSRFRV